MHVVDTTGEQNPSSYVSLFSTTPGKLTKEVDQINEGFICSRDEVVDFVTFSVKYGCLTYSDTDSGWSESEVPILQVDGDTNGNERITQILIDTKGSTRWSLAINFAEIEDFTFKGKFNFKNSALYLIYFLLIFLLLNSCFPILFLSGNFELHLISLCINILFSLNNFRYFTSHSCLDKSVTYTA